MADSVDRVFSHAINTVRKITPGTEKPPASERLKLYGLYKQSMEGDVEGIMERPSGKDEESRQAREKWDAWKSCSGLSRTESRRRYISTLIESMRKYASSSPDSRELVDELEFVWDQVKSNVSASASSSPVNSIGDNETGLGILSPNLEKQQSQRQSTSSQPLSFIDRLTSAARGSSSLTSYKSALQSNASQQTIQAPRINSTNPRNSADLRQFTSSPLSHSALGDESSEEEDDPADFVDAPDSQVAENEQLPRAADLSRQNSGLASLPEEHIKAIGPMFKNSAAPSRPSDSKPDNIPSVLKNNHNNSNDDMIKSPASRKTPPTNSRARQRARMESTLTRLTAEVAALREQLDLSVTRSFSSRFFSPAPSDPPSGLGFWARLLFSAFSFMAKVIIVDVIILVLILIWMRRKRDGRLEGAIRVLLGDAVAVVQRVGREASKGVERVGRVVGKNLSKPNAVVVKKT